MLKLLKNNWFFKDFGISRGGRAHVPRMVLFDRDRAPGERAHVVGGVQRERESCDDDARRRRATTTGATTRQEADDDDDVDDDATTRACAPHGII